MKRISFVLVTALLLGTVGAEPFPDSGRVTLISDSGVVLGVGELEGGNLELSVDASASGFVTVLLEGEDGSVVSVDGMVTAEGQILLMSEGELEDFGASVEASGGSVAVTFEELPTEAQDGMAGAEANFEAAMENAAEAGADVDIEFRGEEDDDRFAGDRGARGEDDDEGDDRADRGADVDGRVDVDVDVDAPGDAPGNGGADDEAEDDEGEGDEADDDDDDASVEVGVGVGVGGDSD